MSRKIILSLAAASLAGCAMPDSSSSPRSEDVSAKVGAQEMENDTPASSPSSPALRVASYRPQGPSALARLTGVIEQRDGCIVLTHDRSVTVPVFPEGSVTVAADGRSITYAGRSYRVGDSLTVGGGAAPTSGPSPRGLSAVGCLTGTLFLVG